VSVAKSDEQVIEEFGEAVNMSSGELEEWLQTEESREVGQKYGGGESKGHESGGRVVDRLQHGRPTLRPRLQRLRRGVAGGTRAGQADISVRSWLGVSKWVDDAAPFPGETFRRWVGDFYQRDKLVKGKMELRGHSVDLSNIRCAVLNVSGKWDYVVPPPQTDATNALVRSPYKEYVSVDAGHVGMLVGPTAKGSLWPRVREWLAPRSG
jgi:pimeloyl-ACP methyl ester carboxylesterase